MRHLAKDKELRAACLIFFGYSSVQLGKQKQALPPLLECRQICLENGFEKTLVLCNEILLSIYSAWDMKREAIKLLEENKSYLEKKGDLLDLASTNYELATKYYETSQYRNALACFEQAKEILIAAANDTKQVDEYEKYSYQVAHCYQDIAEVCHAIGKYEQAIQQYETAKNIFSRLQASNKKDLANCNFALAVNYSLLKEDEKALELYQQAREIHQEEGSELGVAFCDMSIARIYNDAFGDRETALKLYEQARLVFEQHGDQDTVRDIDRDIAILKGNRASPLRNDQSLAGEETSVKDRAISFLRTASSDLMEAANTIKLGEPLLTELDEEPQLAWMVHYRLAKAYRTQT
ncbi:MAG TPA: tetratricopeptide repeat protein, partial [Methylomirabilota bacterium]|nr:tetratricopeptide repeat protein [Methylomirabilota bacterium]